MDLAQSGHISPGEHFHRKVSTYDLSTIPPIAPLRAASVNFFEPARKTLEAMVEVGVLRREVFGKGRAVMAEPLK